MLLKFSSALGAGLLVFTRAVTLSPLADRRRNVRKNEVRRRPGKAQGRALETLAHALEYLVDSDLQCGSDTGEAMQNAIQLIAEKSRAVFAECPEIIPISRRLCGLLPRFLTLPAADEADPLNAIVQTRTHVTEGPGKRRATHASSKRPTPTIQH